MCKQYKHELLKKHCKVTGLKLIKAVLILFPVLQNLTRKIFWFSGRGRKSELL